MRYGDFTCIPAFLMKDQWLKGTGFSTGMKIDVRASMRTIFVTCEKLVG
jgi:hypothetical protein